MINGDNSTERSDAIRSYLRSHYPCQAVPTGAFTPIAEQFGVSRQRVRQIAVGIGITGRLLRSAKPTRRGLCRECDRPKEIPNGRYCREHNSVPMECSYCGNLKILTRRQFGIWQANRIHDRNRSGRFFCSRSCLGKVVGKEVGQYNLHPQ